MAMEAAMWASNKILGGSRAITEWGGQQLAKIPVGEGIQNLIHSTSDNIKKNTALPEEKEPLISQEDLDAQEEQRDQEENQRRLDDYNDRKNLYDAKRATRELQIEEHERVKRERIRLHRETLGVRARIQKRNADRKISTLKGKIIGAKYVVKKDIAENPYKTINEEGETDDFYDATSEPPSRRGSIQFVRERNVDDGHEEISPDDRKALEELEKQQKSLREPSIIDLGEAPEKPELIPVKRRKVVRWAKRNVTRKRVAATTGGVAGAAIIASRLASKLEPKSVNFNNSSKSTTPKGHASTYKVYI